MDEQKYGIPSITPPKQCPSSGFFKLFILVIIIYIFIFLAGIVLVSVGKDNIRKNWVKYRCNPMIIPFAKFFGKDSKKTMRVCTGMIAKSQSKSQLSPFKSQLSGTLGVLGKFGNIFQTLRARASTFRALLMGVFESLYLRMQSLGRAIHYSFVKTSEIMRKNYGVFIVSLRSAMTVYNTFQSMWKGPIGSVARFLCFDGNTEINILNGLTKKIKNIKIGDILSKSSKVISILEFSSDNVEMYNYNDIIVSSTHLVKENNEWIRIADSDLSRKIDKYHNPKIYCLITTNNIIKIGNHIFRDYIELNDNYTNNKMKQYIVEHLNAKDYNKRINIGTNYTFGFKNYTKIKMTDGKSKSIEDIKIGDNTVDGNVYGVVKLVNTSDIYTDGINYFSGNNIVKNTIIKDTYEVNNEWDLVCNSNKYRYCARKCSRKCSKKCGRKFDVLYHITTDTGIVTLENGLQFTDFDETTDENINDRIDRMIESNI